MKKSLADRIEQYLKVLIARSEAKMIEIQRAELAETFSCVPSQVTYVLSTRFTQREGYFTESRRGGCGYVRIMQFDSQERDYLTPDGQLFAFIEGLKQQQLVSGREAEMIKTIALNICQDLPLEFKSKVSEGMMRALKQYFED